MERVNKAKYRKNKARKPPKVPIKTYRWEDIRRSRKRGGYPWTYLYKRPFNERVDPEQFTMDALRRSKSASTVGARSDAVDISEVSSFLESGKTTPSYLHAEIITEPNEDSSAKHSRAGSETIEEYIDEEDRDTMEDVRIKEFQTGSIASSDNISQYLDKDERGPDNSNNTNNKGNDQKADNTTSQQQRAQSEETCPRKRKLSAESSYSKYSLSRLGVMQKLRDAKSKIKVPKMTFPTKQNTRKRDSPSKESKKGDKVKKDPKKSPELSKLKKNIQPVYIHIPLKPPPGESDEFSHLEFEAKQTNGQSGVEEVEKLPEDDKHISDKKEESKSDKVELSLEEKELKSKDEEQSPFSSLEKGPRVTKKPPLKINPAFKQFLKDVRQLKEKEVSEIRKETTTESIDVKPKGEETELKNLVKEEHLDLEEQQTSDNESPKEDVFDNFFDASATKQHPPTSQKQLEDTSSSSRNVRSKSAEPQQKRRSSIDSSYSRKSLSKLGIMKKLKEASEKLKNAFSFSSLKRSDSKKSEKPEKEKEEKVKKKSGVQATKPKEVKPVYIHIPLKPPPGEMDEFSHLDQVTLDNTETKKEERTDSLDSTSPISTKNGDIQFIFLTPPSDDEVLDKDPDIPETPSSEDSSVFFGIGSLKKLAETVVDEISPETKRTQLETVREESTSDKGSTADMQVIGKKGDDASDPSLTDKRVKCGAESPLNEPDKMVVDVEDGLNEAPKAEELKSVLKSPESSSPVLKKKVSFKRKTKPSSIKIVTDSGYEPIEISKQEKTVNLLEQAGIFDKEPGVELSNDTDKNQDGKKGLCQVSDNKGFLADINQSMSVEDEKGYLDQKIIKDTSLEEDYNKWSRSGDHEYEPVNPPEEVTVMTSSGFPGLTVIDSDNEPKVVISATEILDKQVEEKKKPFFQFGRFGKKNQEETGKHYQEGPGGVQSQSSIGGELSDVSEPSKASHEQNKFQLAFKQRTDQLKSKTSEIRNKMRNMKKPSIHMPKANFKTPDFKNFKFDKPKINLHLPKIPDTATIHLPHISLPGARKATQSKTVETRQYSTESNAGDSGSPKPRSKFDFDFSGTFPRFRKKKPSDEQAISYGTTPRTKKHKEMDRAATQSSSSSIHIPLHSEDSFDVDDRFDRDIEPIPVGYEDRETSEDIGRPSHMRFNKDIDIEDEYARENQEINRADYLNRWQHGSLRQSEREMGDGEANEDEKIIEQLIKERFKRIDEGYDNGIQSEPSFERYEDNQSETLEDRLRKDEARPHFYEDDEAFEQGNKDMITDLDNLEEDEREIQIRDGYSSEGSVSLQRRGRLGKLDVNSDEFFVVHEIREGFQTPANALAQMNEYDPIGSNKSLSQVPIKKKPIKKPKRKKTPHVSQEEIPGDEESIERSTSPSRPKRKSKKNKKRSDKHDDDDGIVPYQRTIHLEREDIPQGHRLDFPRESLGILGDDEREDMEFEMYENEKMQGKEQPEISVTDPYKHFYFMEQQMREREEIPISTQEPIVPPRRHRSMKSLTQSEAGSISTDKYDNRQHEPTNIEDYIIPDHEIQAPPRRPSRRSRSQTSSLSRVSLPPSTRDTDSLLADEVFLTDNQSVPSYLIENQNYKQRYKEENHGVPAYQQEDLPMKPCVEEPCVQDLRDYMGYSIVDKSRQREPPLPPPKTTPRRKKRQVESEQRFATVPRNLGSTQPSTSHPVRPLRNYSTLSQVKNSQKESSLYENDDKENRELDIARYVEIEDELSKDLISGEVVQKMRQRPLPAPPRPPRKTKTSRKSLQDITSKENIIPTVSSMSETKPVQVEEETVSTQTDPLPPDFVCEEIPQEPTDTIITPRVRDKNNRIIDEKEQEIKRELITPTVYSYEETVTHGSLLVEPLNGAKLVPDHQLSRERLVVVSKEEFDEESSEIPESFNNLKSPEVEEPSGKYPGVLRTDKLQVTDLDVDCLRVNELLASKIVVSEIDSANISTNEIKSKSGPLRLGEIELPERFLEEIVKKLEDLKASGEERVPKDADTEEKKTSTCEDHVRTLSDLQTIVEPSLDSSDHLESTSIKEQSEFQPDMLENDQIQLSMKEQSECQPDTLENVQVNELSTDPPVPPPRSFTLENVSPDAPPRTLRRKSKDSSRHPDERPSSNFNSEKTDQSILATGPPKSEMLEPEIDDNAPPRPPQPLEGLYMPSQPPASFYALRAQQYVGLDSENIPAVPRRKRRQSSRSRPRSRSTSGDSSQSPSQPMTRSPRTTRRFSEPSIPDLSGRLIRACGTRINVSLKRLIYHLTENILLNADGKQDLHVMMIILLVLIAGLILLGYGEERTVVHLHHWEYFNPPKDL